MADVRDGLFLENNSATINGFYESLIVRVGVDALAVRQDLEVETAFSNGIGNRRIQASGVSIDEEVTSLLLFQRAFEASARVISVVDRMVEALFAAVR